MASKLISTVLFFIALFLRTFRIEELTEFLGDQGRTGIVIYEALINKTVPLVGPNVLSGHFLGPFFYYLIGPSFILSNFNPVVPAIFTAILGSATVALLFLMGKQMFGIGISFFIALMYAVSPSLVMQERVIWEPNPIPFFILLVIIACYKIYKKSLHYFPLLGAALGILVQLHYPNLFLIVIAFLLILYLLFKEKNIATMSLLKWSAVSMFFFFLTLLPFIVYETKHSFEDVREVLLIFLRPNNTVAIYPPLHIAVMDMSSRLFKNIIPLQQSPFFTLLQVVIIFIPFLAKRQFWHIFFTLWFTGGILLISLYKGVIFDHYLNFILPIPFFLFGFFLQSISKKINKAIIFALLIVAVSFHISQTDIFSEGKNDIARTKEITKSMISQSNGIPFSFTLTQSRSFSDLHYRYFFTTKWTTPKKISSDEYTYLFLVCEKLPCPTKEEQENILEVKALCYDDHCSGEYPTIQLTKFKLIESKRVLDSMIFTYQRIQK